MIKFHTIKYLLLPLFIAGSCFTETCFAQVDPVKTDSAAVRVDSTVVEAPPAENSTTTIDRKDSLQYFDQITQQPVFYERKIKDSTINRIKKDEAYWYADQQPGKQKQDPEKKTSSMKPWVINLIWVVMLIVFVAVLVWYIVAGNIRIFRKAPISLKEESEPDYEENLFTINFESEIKKAMDSNNYRLAIRLLFLHALKQLNNNEIIVYKPARTNADYLFQMYGGPYYKPFFRLTRIFDYVWYGKFQLNAEGYNELQKEFVQFNDQLQK